jgi:predicted enzyme related to lactoylglutathione lyase
MARLQQLTPLLFVKDLPRSLAFYRDQLGFACTNHADAEGKTFWCRIERDGASLMLQQADGEDPHTDRRGRGVTFYFICDDANAMHTELCGRGMELAPPEMAYYGMNQLFVPEPDGYEICFESDSR